MCRCVLAGFACLLLSPGAQAEPELGPPPREVLYKGRSLSSWKGQLLEAGQPVKQLEAIRALEELGPLASSAVNELLELAVDEKEKQDVRTAAEAAARHIGLPSVALLIAAHEAAQPTLRRKPLRTEIDREMYLWPLKVLHLHGKDAEPAIPLLIKEIGLRTADNTLNEDRQASQSEDLRLAYADMILQRIGKPAVKPLIEAGTSAVKTSPHFAMARYGVVLVLMPDAAPLVAELLTDDRIEARKFAAMTLGMMRTRAAAALPALRRLAKADPDEKCRSVAQLAVQEIEYDRFRHHAAQLVVSVPAGPELTAALLLELPDRAPRAPQPPRQPQFQIPHLQPQLPDAAGDAWNAWMFVKLGILVVVLLGSVIGWLTKKNQTKPVEGNQPPDAGAKPPGA